MGEINAALDDTRAHRVTALSAELVVPAHLAAVVREVPSDAGARQAWCGLAYRIESYRDRHPEALGHEAHGGVVAAIGAPPGGAVDAGSRVDDLAGQLRHAAELVRVRVPQRTPEGAVQRRHEPPAASPTFAVAIPRYSP